MGWATDILCCWSTWFYSACRWYCWFWNRGCVSLASRSFHKLHGACILIMVHDIWSREKHLNTPNLLRVILVNTQQARGILVFLTVINHCLLNTFFGILILLAIRLWICRSQNGLIVNLIGDLSQRVTLSCCQGHIYNLRHKG